MTDPKDYLAKRWKDSIPQARGELVRLRDETQSLNVGTGFPDYLPPPVVREALQEVACTSEHSLHQYSRSMGHPRLVKALSETYSPLFGRNINVKEEILVTIGANESLFCSVNALVEPGDEVIVIEPHFYCYVTLVKVAGGTPVLVSLKPSTEGLSRSSADWKLDPEELASKFNSKTKMLMLSNPNNPLGKVMTREELEMIAELCRKHDVIVISDEVYEWLVYAPSKHTRIATLPGMWERTVTIGSAGKTFSVTGWKLGWSIGPKHFIRCLAVVHSNCNHVCPTPMQQAAENDFFVLCDSTFESRSIALLFGDR